MTATRREFIGTLAAASAVRAFGMTPTDVAPVVRFGFITDCHYAAHIPEKPGERRRYREGLAKMRTFVQTMNGLKPDFVVEGGDFKDLGRTPEESLSYLDAIEAEFARFEGPRYHVLGNHDHDNISKGDFLAHISNAGQESAKAWYSFDVKGVRFIVLDACYKSDGTPYDRGRFSWRDTFLPPEQVEFLRSELESAPGPCVPIVHQQLDAEDDTCIANAAEVRRVIEESGKVKCVIQGHWHEGSFREIGGIAYFSSKANVIDSAPDANAFSLVEIYPSGGAKIECMKPKREFASRPHGGWRGGFEWSPGRYQVHFIYTGRGEAMFHIFPDGTTMLLDCGDSMRFLGTPQEAPMLPDLSCRAGEHVARYVERVNPKGRNVDFFHLSHYHEDHGGGERWHGERISAPTGDYWLCGLGDAARFLAFGKIVDRAWPGFDYPLDALAKSRDGTPRNVRAVYRHLAAARGTQVEKFRLGARDQFVQLNAAAARREFSVFNLCANGRFVQRDGSVCDLYAHRVAAGERSFNENGMSCGLVVSYGQFRFFTAGDFSDNIAFADGTRGAIESRLAEAVGPVDVAKASHHGHHSMPPELVRALRARVWTACVLDRQHMTDDTCMRLSDRSLYGGDRLILPTWMPQDRPGTAFGRTYLKDVARPVKEEPCNVVLDVSEGGNDYTFRCFSAADHAFRLKAEYGLFTMAKASRI